MRPRKLPGRLARSGSRFLLHKQTARMAPTISTRPPKAKRNEFTKVLALALAPAGEAVTVADSAGYIIEANTAVERVYRLPLKKIIGQHALKFCPDTPEWSKFSLEIWRMINQDGGWDGVVVNKDAEGREFSILLRTRMIVWSGVPYSISWARPFPDGAPFDLSEQQAHCFLLSAQGCNARQIAARLSVTEGTVKEHCRRIWRKAGRLDKFCMGDFKCLALRCAEAGWDPAMQLNGQFASTHHAIGQVHPL